MRYLFALPLLALALPAAAQEHDHSGQTTQPEPQAPTEHDRSAQTAQPSPEAEPDHSRMDHSAHEPQSGQPAMDHSQIDHSQMDHGEMDHSQMNHGEMDHSTPPGADPAPPPRAFEGPRHAADEIYGQAAMDRAREQARLEHGVIRTGQVLVERLEARLGEDEDLYLWDLQAFYGGDHNRFVLQSEGEGAFEGDVEDAEVQALWSHAIGPFVDLQAGARLDVEPETRSHAALGVQGLAPYMIHFDAAVFLSDRGDLTGRVEAEYDQKITQRLILQPRVELEAAAQDIPEREMGAGFTSVEAGLRLRYEIVPEFSPYVGVGWERKLGRTGEIAEANGEHRSSTALLLGLRTWF